VVTALLSFAVRPFLDWVPDEIERKNQAGH
jgi:hypothetical protein